MGKTLRAATMSVENAIGRMLDRFEAKHGSYYDLLAQYPAITAYGQPDEAENKRLERLMRHHDKLCWACTGYNRGFEDGLKAAKERT